MINGNHVKFIYDVIISMTGQNVEVSTSSASIFIVQVNVVINMKYRSKRFSLRKETELLYFQIRK